MLEHLKEAFKKRGHSHMGYLGCDPRGYAQLYEAKLSPKEQRRVEKQFDPSADSCQMDTIARVLPEKLIPR